MGQHEFFVNTNGTLFKQNPALRYAGNIPGIVNVSTRVGGAARQVLKEPETAGQISSPMDRYSIFARGTFDFTDNISLFMQGNMSEFDIDQILTYAPATSFWDAKIPRDAAHPIPAELAALLDSRALAVPPGQTPVPGSAASQPGLSNASSTTWARAGPRTTARCIR